MSPENDTPQHDDDPALILALDIWGDENMRGDALDAIEALKEAGFEITKRSELGVTKGLPGIPDNLVDLTGSLMGEVLSERIKPSALDQMAPGATQAAQTGMEIANRTIAYGSLDPDEALKMALDLIGRRTDVVAVQLPEPDSTCGGSRYIAGWDALGDHDSVRVDCFGRTEYEGMDFTSDDLRELAAIFLAAANVADAAEDGGK